MMNPLPDQIRRSSASPITSPRTRSVTASTPRVFPDNPELPHFIPAIPPLMPPISSLNQPQNPLDAGIYDRIPAATRSMFSDRQPIRTDNYLPFPFRLNFTHATYQFFEERPESSRGNSPPYPTISKIERVENLKLIDLNELQLPKDKIQHQIIRTLGKIRTWNFLRFWYWGKKYSGLNRLMKDISNIDPSQNFDTILDRLKILLQDSTTFELTPIPLLNGPSSYVISPETAKYLLNHQSSHPSTRLALSESAFVTDPLLTELARLIFVLDHQDR